MVTWSSMFPVFWRLQEETGSPVPHFSPSPGLTEEFMSHSSPVSSALKHQKLISQCSFIAQFKVQWKDVLQRGCAFLFLLLSL